MCGRHEYSPHFSVAHSARFVYQLARRWIVSSKTKRPKLQVLLTCECGTAQYPHSHNFPTRCVNPSCMNHVSEVDKIRYIETILALLEVAELNPDPLAQALN